MLIDALNATKLPYVSLKIKKYVISIYICQVTKRTPETNAAGENSLFIFTVCVKYVPLYHFKLAYVIIHMAVKEFLKPTSKNGETGRFNWSLLKESFQLTLKFHSSVPSNMKSTCRIFIHT